MTVIVQLDPAGTDVGQLFVCVKSALPVPVIPTARLRAAVPLLVSVTGWPELVTPAVWLPNEREFGEGVAVGVAGDDPPDTVRLIEPGLPEHNVTPSPKEPALQIALRPLTVTLRGTAPGPLQG